MLCGVVVTRQRDMYSWLKREVKIEWESPLALILWFGEGHPLLLLPAVRCN